MVKYNVGDKVRIVDHRNWHWNVDGEMDKWMGKVMTIRSIDGFNSYSMEEDATENGGLGWGWGEEDIAALVEKAAEPAKKEVKEVKSSKRTVYDLDFLECMLFSMEMAEIQSEYSQRCVNLAVKYGIDEINVLETSNKSLVASIDDPEFVEKILPIMIEDAKENEDEE